MYNTIQACASCQTNGGQDSIISYVLPTDASRQFSDICIYNADGHSTKPIARSCFQLLSMLTTTRFMCIFVANQITFSYFPVDDQIPDQTAIPFWATENRQFLLSCSSILTYKRSYRDSSSLAMVQWDL